MTVFLPLLVSVVVLATAIRSETDGDWTTSLIRNPKTDGNAKCCAGDNLEGDFQVRSKRSPSAQKVVEVASWKGVPVPNVKSRQRSKGKESPSDMELRTRRKGVVTLDEDESRGGQQEERERGNQEEVFEDREDGLSNGGQVVLNSPSRYGVKPSANTVQSATESNQKSRDNAKGGSFRNPGEDSKGINRFLANGSRTRRDLKTLKRMLDDVGAVSTNSDELPEEQEPPEMNEKEPEIEDYNFEVPEIGESLSGDAIRRQDFSKRPQYYPDWGPKRTWRINMMRVWGKRYLAGYDKKHASRND